MSRFAGEASGPVVRTTAACRIQWRQSIMPYPVQFGATFQQEFGGLALSAMAGTPECIGDVRPEQALQHRQNKRSRGASVPAPRSAQRGLGAPLDQPPRRLPLPEGNRIRQ